MRNALVVLVPLCIGLTSGFIVPSGTREPVTKNVDFEVKKTTDKSNNKTLYIENYKIEELNKDLYIDPKNKDANISERSFIYIKQRTKKPFQNQILLNIIPKERIDDNKRDKSFLLNRNNVFEEFPRRFAIGHTYIDKNIIDNTLRLDKPENLPHDHRFDSNIKRKYHISDVKSTLKMKAVTSKPNNQYFNDILAKHILTVLPDKVTCKLGFSEGKLDNAMDNSNSYKKKYLQKIYKDTIDGIEVDGLVLNASLDKPPVRENNTQLNRYGFYYCLDCVKKLKKQNFKKPLFIKKKCN